MVLSEKRTFRLVSILLTIVLCSTLLSPIALARASYYIDAYDAYMTVGSNGSVTAWFQITGTGVMDEIGATKISIYEDGKLVATYKSSDTSGLMTVNKGFHSGSVTYAGTAGKTYYASVTYQCGRGGDWDNRTKETTTVTAKK